MAAMKRSPQAPRWRPPSLLLVLAATCPALAFASELSSSSGIKFSARAGFKFSANPVRRVVQMLQMLMMKATEEFDKEGALFDKIMCGCMNQVGSLKESVSDATEKLPQLDATIKGSKAEETELQSDIAHTKAERADSQNTLDEAKKTRDKEAEAHTEFHDTTTADITNLEQAIHAMEAGRSDATGAAVYQGDAGAAGVADVVGDVNATAAVEFLQDAKNGGVVRALKRIVAREDVVKDDKDMVMAFLSGSSESRDVSYDEILGILKQIHESMSKDLADAILADEKAQTAFENLKAAKEGQIETMDGVIKEKGLRLGELGLSIVNDVEDREQTAAILEEDTRILDETQKSCKTKQEQWKERTAYHMSEHDVIGETIRMLNSQMMDRVLQKTLPVPIAPTFLQIGRSGGHALRRAEQLVSGVASQSGDARISLLALNSRVHTRVGSRTRARQQGFEKVIKMIDDMVDQLQEEQAADDKKRSYCIRGLEKGDDKTTDLGNMISDQEKEQEESSERQTLIAEEIAVLQKGIKELDKQVQEATAQRKEENLNYIDALSEQNAAKEVLIMAKRRLERFYGTQGELYGKQVVLAEANATAPGAARKPRPSRAAAPAPQDQAAGAESDGDIALEALGGAPVFTQMSKAEPPPEESNAQPEQQVADVKTLKLNPFAGKGGPKDVYELIDKLVQEIDEDTEQMKKDEKEAQVEYEIAQTSATEKRETDIKAIAAKEAVRVKLEEKMHHLKMSTKAKKKDLTSHKEYMTDLHRECDGLLEKYELLKRVRSEEVEALRSAKAILMDADQAFLQKGQQPRRLQRQSS